MTEREPYKWITVKGKHIPVYKDEHGQDVFGVGQEEHNIGGLTKQSWESTKGYTDTPTGNRINNALRGGREREIEQYKKTIERLDSNMESTKEKMTVYREQGLDYILDQIGKPEQNTFESLKAFVTGKTFTEKGYYSSYYENSGNQYADSILETEVPKGTKAILTSNDKEKEVILSRNGTYKINDLEMKNGQFYFKVQRIG